MGQGKNYGGGQNPPEHLMKLEGHDQREVRYGVTLPLLNKRFAIHHGAKLRNLSTTGAFLETVPERVDRILDLEFSFPGQKNSFHVTARVLWARDAKLAFLKDKRAEANWSIRPGWVRNFPISLLKLRPRNPKARDQNLF